MRQRTAPTKRNKKKLYQSVQLLFYQILTKHAQQETSSDGGADDAGHVRAHCMHQQEVGGVGLLALCVGHACCHRNSRHTGSSLGTPNLGAIEEYARVNERYTYLTGQRDDVLVSKRELEGIIREITQEMTTIFVAEFAKINAYFGKVFEEMFGGGKGQLILEDPEELPSFTTISS